MVKARKREEVIVEIEPESDLAKALAAAGKKPVTIVSAGQRYVASRDPFDPGRDYEIKAFREALHAVAGTLTPEEGERLKRDIYPWRDEHSRRIDPGPDDFVTDDELWADYDPERVRAAVRAAAGSLTEEEGERLKALIYEGRELGTRPIDRP